MRLILILNLLILPYAFGSMEDIQRVLRQRTDRQTKYAQLIIALRNEGLEFSAIPFLKEYLVRGSSKNSERLDAAFDQIISKVGVRIFETLPIKYLRSSKLNSARYALAKKYLRVNNLNLAINTAKQVRRSHPAFPFTQNILGVAYSIQGKYSTAISAFRQCEDSSEDELSNAKSYYKKQLMLNRDTCRAGIARTYFAARDYSKSELAYLDIDKSSPVWPEILFEEAWNSYYKGDYNRTLGKLVTYKAPIFDFVFNPEIEVLEALSYYKLCHFDQAKNSVNKFYSQYSTAAKKLRNILGRYKNDVIYFANLMIEFERRGGNQRSLIARMLRDIQKEGALLEIKESTILADKEIKKLKGYPGSKMRNLLMQNVYSVQKAQKKLLGAVVKGRLISLYRRLQSSFEGMSYLKLEILAQKKRSLYRNTPFKESMGEKKILDANDKQYYFDFNGEFWADELGDYVFAMRSKC